MDEFELAPGQWRCAEIDRAAAAELIERALLDGRLNQVEHVERTNAIRVARTYDELNAQTADLGAIFAAQQEPQIHTSPKLLDTESDFSELQLDEPWTPYASNELAQIFPQLDSTPSLIQDEASQGHRSPENRTSISVMGTHKRTADWMVPESLNTFVLMGETIYDLRNAIFTSPRVTLSVAVTMGSVTLYLPDGVNVIDNTTKIMADSAFKGIRPTNPHAPEITVDGFLFMGELSVIGSGHKSWSKFKGGLNRELES